MRYALGDALISMLCEAFNYKLDLEDTIDKQETQMTVSSDSKADYACWVLRKVDATNREDVCVVIVEAKHLESKHSISFGLLLYKSTGCSHTIK